MFSEVGTPRVLEARLLECPPKRARMDAHRICYSSGLICPGVRCCDCLPLSQFSPGWTRMVHGDGHKIDVIMLLLGGGGGFIHKGRKGR